MEGQLNLTQQNVTGRIIKSLGGFYYVAAEQEDRVIECRARGVFRQQNIKPCVGDWVEVELTDEGKGYVVKVQPRKNSLVRPPLANLDQLVLVVSIADPAPNAFVLDQPSPSTRTSSRSSSSPNATWPTRRTLQRFTPMQASPSA